MKQFVRCCLAFPFLLLVGNLVANLRAQFYSVQSNTLKSATITFNVEGNMLLDKHWTLNMSVSYNPWNFSDIKEIKYFLIEPGARYWLWQPYAGSFISMYATSARFNAAWDKVLDYRYRGWGYGARMICSRSWLLGRRWNMEVEAGLELLVTPYTKCRCEHCGDEVRFGAYFLLTPKVAFNLVYLF